MKKASVINVLNSLPENFNLEEFVERLIVVNKIEDGLDDVKHGRLVDHDDVKKLFKAT